MLKSSALLPRSAVYGIRRGDSMHPKEIDPFRTGARALVVSGKTGEKDVMMVRMGRRIPGKEEISFGNNFFIGTKENGLDQLRERNPRRANDLPQNATSLFDAHGLPSPIRVQHGGYGTPEAVAFGAYTTTEPLQLLSPDVTFDLLRGIHFFQLPDIPVIREIYLMDQFFFVVRTRETDNGHETEYLYGTENTPFKKIKPTEPEAFDPHAAPFDFYLETPAGRVGHFRDSTWGFALFDPDKRMIRISPEFLLERNVKIAFEEK